MVDASSSGFTGWLLNAAYASGTLCAGALLLLFMFQDKLLYFPSIPGASKLTRENPQGYRHPGEFNIEYDDLMIPTADGVHVHAWLMKQPNARNCPTIIFFHGNAGNIGYRLPNAVHLYRKVGANILLVDYRGFGHSDGEPSERGLKLDADAVLAAMHARTDIDPTALIVFGRSLGGAVAVYLAEKEPTKIAGVILENTFLSISSMVDSLMPLLRYVKPLVLRIEWDNAQTIERVRVPILFVAGLQDELVPPQHMQTLYHRATQAQGGDTKRHEWFTVRNGTHNDTWLRGGDRYFAQLRSFIERVTATATCRSTDKEPATTTTEAHVTHEGTIPTMLQQPLVNSLHHL